MPSPYKQPKEIKELKGTHRKSRDTPQEMSVRPLTSVPMPPEDLPEPAKKTWFAAASQLLTLKILTGLDLDALKQYCYQKHVMDMAAHTLETEGYTVIMQNKGGGQYPTKSPWISIYNEAATHVNRLQQQFGFNPSARTKISVGQVKEEKKNPFDGF
jgi:P27 family predicted phage terminase small subunit